MYSTSDVVTQLNAEWADFGSVNAQRGFRVNVRA